MSTLVRRHHPRITLPFVPYIHIAPGNGGIVLNISRDGLCFQSVAPLGRNGPVHFFFKENNRHLAGCAELVWVAAGRRHGGLKFTSLSPEARAQVDEWVAQAPAHQGSEGALPKEPVTDCDEGPVHDDTCVMPSAEGFRPAEAPNTIASGRLSARVLASAIIAVLAGSIIFGYAHRGEMGESLIRLGQRMAKSARAQNEASPADGAETALHVTPSSADARQVDQTPDAQIPTESNISQEGTASRTDEDDTLSVPDETRRVGLRPQDSTPSTPADTGAVEQQHSAVISPPVLSLAPASPLPEFELDAASAGPHIPGTSGLESADSVLEMYFDVGKFKDEASAQDVSDRVAQFGLSTSVVKKRFLWKTSYQVLVGPYTDPDEESRALQELSSQGYKPRPFERGSRRVLFFSRLNLNGSRLPAGDSLTISWESYVENAKVRFSQGGDVIATASGKWIKRPTKYSRDECVYVTEGLHKTLIEIHFSGQNRALVFRDSS